MDGMVQFGPVDLFVDRATNVLTSKIFMLRFCARKREVEKCVGSTQETDGVSCMSLHQFLSKAPSHPGELAPDEVSYGISTFLGFCNFFSLSVFEWQWKVKEIRTLQRNLNPPREMTPAPGRSLGNQMAVGSVMVESWPHWFFRDGEDSSDMFPKRRI